MSHVPCRAESGLAGWALFWIGCMINSGTECVCPLTRSYRWGMIIWQRRLGQTPRRLWHRFALCRGKVLLTCPSGLRVGGLCLGCAGGSGRLAACASRTGGGFGGSGVLQDAYLGLPCVARSIGCCWVAPLLSAVWSLSSRCLSTWPASFALFDHLPPVSHAPLVLPLTPFRPWPSLGAAFFFSRRLRPWPSLGVVAFLSCCCGLAFS